MDTYQNDWAEVCTDLIRRKWKCPVTDTGTTLAKARYRQILTTPGAAEGCDWTPTNAGYAQEEIEAHARAVCRDAGFSLNDAWLPAARAIYWVVIAAHSHNGN